ADLERVFGRGKIGPRDGEDDNLHHQQEHEAAGLEAGGARRTQRFSQIHAGRPWLLIVAPAGLALGGLPASETAARMTAPRIARSECASIGRTSSAGPIVANSSPPNTVQKIVPRPPLTAVPPTTTAAIDCISNPFPALGSTTAKRTSLSSAARAASTPDDTNTPKTIRRGRMPTSRAASASLPVA